MPTPTPTTAPTAAPTAAPVDGLGLHGARVLIAGAGGLGGACAGGFATQRARVMVVDTDADRLAALDRRLDLAGAGGGTMRADLRQPAACREVVDRAADHLGALDIFVHAVGVNHRQPIDRLTDIEWDDILTINLSSAYWLGQAVGRRMRAQPPARAGTRGRIVFVSSVSGLLAHADHGPYAASKGGLNQLLRVMAHEWAAEGVGVNAVAPGYVETELTRDYLDRPGVRDSLTGLVPAGRLGTPEEIVGPTLFLACPLSSFVTGQVLYVDGGRTLV